jgi:hypothetical protein
MKKIAVILLMLLFVTGCSLFSFGTKDSLTGVLSEQKRGDDVKGTHILTDENNEVFPLNSTVLNLSSPQYLGNKVEVQVKFDDSTKVYNVTGISVLEVLEKNGSQANWKTFIHQGLGFKFKYYDNWTVEDYYRKPVEAIDSAVTPSTAFDIVM